MLRLGELRLVRRASESGPLVVTHKEATLVAEHIHCEV